jgi:hypothetical protein
MAKVSRPIVYTVVGSLVVGAIVFLTQPDTPTAKKRTLTSRSSSTSVDGISDADLKAHFDRYKGGVRDPFAAGVVANLPGMGVPGAPAIPTGKSGWQLTGINVINGVKSALIENAATKDSAFLKVGDTWNGLHVVAIQDETVQLTNAVGQQTSLTFAAAPDDKSASVGVSGSSGPVDPAVPSLSAIQPLPPIGAVDPSIATPSDTGNNNSNGNRRSRRRRSFGGNNSGDRAQTTPESSNVQ